MSSKLSHCPRLERLTIYKHWNQQALQLFLVRANHLIEFVQIHNMSDRDLFNCLQVVPSFTNFQFIFPVGAMVLRLSTSALAGDPDPNLRVFNFLIAILGSTPVSATR